MNSIEINGSFYSLQRPASYRKWFDETPDDFLFSLKGPKYLTHMKKLADIEVPLANFFASGLLLLGKKLGPILWQFPPWWQLDMNRMSDFLKLLPGNTREASRLAANNELKDPSWVWTDAVSNNKLRYAFEPRHPSFFTPEFVDLLRRHNAALVMADTAGKWPFTEDLTADFVYIRLHGSKELYASGYTPEELDRWAGRIKLWKEGKEPNDATKIVNDTFMTGKSRDVFVYFDNDIKVHAPFDAIALASRLSNVKR